MDNPGNEKTGHTIVGCVAGDEDCYTTFADLFDALINRIHGHYPPTARQDIDLSVCEQAEDCAEDDCLDPAYILGYEMQAKRNIAGYNLSPLCSRCVRACSNGARQPCSIVRCSECKSATPHVVIQICACFRIWKLH